MSAKLLVLIACLIPLFGHAVLFKCRESDGHFSYSDQPCRFEEVPMNQQGSFSSVKIPIRNIPPNSADSPSSGGVTSSGSSSGGSSGGSSGAKPASRSHY
jgi:uncharacterized membrane protein YgcG